jgi:predicted metalloprotease
MQSEADSMKWQGRERSGNVEDRRGQTGGGLGGGLGGGGLNPFGRGGGMNIPMGRGRGGIGGIITIIVVLGIIWVVSGQNPLEVLTGGQTSAPSSSSTSKPLETGTGDAADFVAVVVKETENMWTEVFQQNNMTYQKPNVVLFSDATESGCGVAQSASGPFYCPEDQKVYIDLTFYDQLQEQFGAPGDFAQAYVIAHEIGHHVQNLLGVLPDFNARRAQMSEEEANAFSVKVELQADCYAGVWANYAGHQDLLEAGDTGEAINAAGQIGDDTLTRGQVAPRNFTHGTSEQRQTWLQRGMKSGDVGQCDTFAPGAV